MFSKIVTFLFFVLTVTASARPYRYYLDPNRAEEILAGIVLRPRMSQEQWIGIIQNQKTASYTVQPGDNLWNISRRLFGDAWLWRKVWQVNDVISNPHEIEAGRILAYYREEPNTPGEWRIPVVKLVPEGKSSLNDLDSDRFVNVDIKQRHRITNFVLNEEDVLGEITGSYSPKRALGHEDAFYASFKPGLKVNYNDTFIIAHEERDLRDLSDASRPYLGRLMTTVGELKVVTIGEKLVRAELIGVFGPVRRGDKILSMQKTVSWAPPTHPPSKLISRILMGETPEQKTSFQGGLVLMTKGIEEGMKPGFMFRVYADTDPDTDRRDTVEPYFKGEIQVVYSGKSSSLGYIVRNSEPILIGDTLVPYQAFEDPPPPKSNPNDTVEIP